MDENQHKTPAAVARSSDDRSSREDSPEVRFLLRIFLGFFGGSFLGVVSYLALWYSFDPRLLTETPVAIAALFGFLLGAPIVALGVFSRHPAVRILAWAVGGAGFGDILLAILAGGLGFGEVLTPVGILMAIVAATIGYRTVPPIALPKN